MDHLFRTKECNDCGYSKLLNIREEMLEEHSGEKELILNTAMQKDAMYRFYYLVWNYMRRYYKPDQFTVLNMLRKLYGILVTGETGNFIENESEKNRIIMEKITLDDRRKSIFFLMSLLHYYFRIYERRYHAPSTWEKIDDIYVKACNIEQVHTEPDRMTVEAGNDQTEKESVETAFIMDLYEHMNQKMVGQIVLKKKMCILLSKWKYQNIRSIFMMIGPSGSGKNHMIETIKSYSKLDIPVITYDCSQLTPNGFSGDSVNVIFDKARKVLDEKRAGEKCIIYLDEIDKIIYTSHDAHDENVNAFVQYELLSALAGTETINGVDTGKCLFILGGAFEQLKEIQKEKEKQNIGFGRQQTERVVDGHGGLRDELRTIGATAEIVGRIEEIIMMDKLSRDDLREVLMNEEIGFFYEKQEAYQRMNKELYMDEDTVEAILDMIQDDPSGARSVKNIMNQLADSAFLFDMTVNNWKALHIHKQMLFGDEPIFE